MAMWQRFSDKYLTGMGPALSTDALIRIDPSATPLLADWLTELNRAPVGSIIEWCNCRYMRVA